MAGRGMRSLLRFKSICIKYRRKHNDIKEIVYRMKSQNIYTQIILALMIVMVLFMARPSIGSGTEYQRETPVVNAVRKVSPAVVNISSRYEVRKRANPFSGFGMDPFFDSFFKDFFDPGFEQRYQRSSLGSGVIIDGKRGFILTNAHVIEKTGTIKVVLNDEREFEAQIIGADPDSDLAVLRIESKTPLPAIEMGNSDDLMIGETVIAIGNPFGFSHTVTTGVISALSRSIRTDDRVFQDFIQTDASINPGNSGGPLLNINGDLIGINTAIYAKAQGIGFAIPINKARRIISDLIRHGEVIPAWIGIVVQDIDNKLAKYLNIPVSKGVLVKEVEKNSPAGEAGIREGDIILSLGNKKLQSSQDFQSAMNDFASGDTLQIDLQRGGKEQRVSVKAAVFPMGQAKALIGKLLGVAVENIGTGRRHPNRTTATEGVVISELQPQSYLARIGARPGDVIRRLDDIPIKDIKDFEKAMIKYRNKSSVVMLLQRDSELYYITVKL
ncbi:MAG: Do family serine endopeptidase [Desulfobacterales bacterium]|nr:Do family serine endopeptidase [Desulfobacterales bacterium]